MLRRGLRVLVLAPALCWWLVGCGPGTGGTGTGPVTGAQFYSAAAQFAPPGTLLPTCEAACDGHVDLVVGSQRVELAWPCQQFVYEGGWTFDGQGRATLTGRWTRPVVVDGQTTIVQQDAQVTLWQLDPAAEDTGLLLTVLDGAGQTVLGPVQVERRTGGAVSNACLSQNGLHTP